MQATEGADFSTSSHEAVSQDHSSLGFGFADHVRPLLDTVDRLRTLGVDGDVSLPRIVVIGDQSTGKSSVLEGISGCELPRGSGTVTRTAIELRLKSTGPVGQSGGFLATVSWIENQPGRRSNSIEVTHRSELSDAVQRAQRAVTDPDTGFGTSNVVVEVHDPQAPDLTLIDLPGIVRNASIETRASGAAGTEVASGQLAYQQVVSMIRDNISPPNTVILIVHNATTDLATSEAVQLAREVDPARTRSLIVFTKADYCQPVDANRVCAFVSATSDCLGSVVVRNRTDQELLEHLTLKEVRAQEERFFAAHEVFLSLKPSQRGTKALSDRLTRLLVQRIRETLPSVRKSLEELRAQNGRQLEALGKSLAPKSRAEAAVSLSRELMKLEDEFNRLFGSKTRLRISRSHPGGKEQTLWAYVQQDERVLYTRVHAHEPPSSTELAVAIAQRGVEDFPEALHEYYSRLQDRIDSAASHHASITMRNESIESLVREELTKLEDGCREHLKNIRGTVLESMLKVVETHTVCAPLLQVVLRDLVTSVNEFSFCQLSGAVTQYFCEHRDVVIVAEDTLGNAHQQRSANEHAAVAAVRPSPLQGVGIRQGLIHHSEVIKLIENLHSTYSTVSSSTDNTILEHARVISSFWECLSLEIKGVVIRKARWHLITSAFNLLRTELRSLLPNLASMQSASRSDAACAPFCTSLSAACRSQLEQFMNATDGDVPSSIAMGLLQESYDRAERRSQLAATGERLKSALHELDAIGSL